MERSPPGDLGQRTLPLTLRPEGERWWRIHSADRGPRWFGPAPGEPPANRFDDPQGEYRVCYLGASLAASVAETLLRNPPRRLLSLSELHKLSVTEFRLRRPVHLTEMHGPGLAWLGLTTREVAGDYDLCGRWARAIWEHSPQVEGIRYRSRHDDSELCIALFDRAEDALEETVTERLLDDPARLHQLLQRYGVRLTR